MRLRIAFHRAETWWIEPIAPHALAVIRIITGTVLFCFALSHVPNLALLFSTAGVAVPHFDFIPVLSALWAYVLAAVLLAGTIGLARGTACGYP